MNSHPWTLVVHSFSVVVKREAVVRRFEGGLAEFERVYNPPQKNGALSLIVCRSLADVEQVRSLLAASGLRPREDFTFADMMHGPLEPHPGFLFATDGVGWTVSLGEDGKDTHGSFVRPDEIMPRSYQFVTDAKGCRSLVLKFEETHDDRQIAARDENTVADSNGPSSQFGDTQSPESGRNTLHTIRTEYTEGSLATHDCWDVVGEVEIDVDGSTLSLIKSGAQVEIEPLAIRPIRTDPDLQWDSFLWRFNNPKPGNFSIIVPVEDDASDWLEAVATWIDGEAQPAPPRYWDE